MNEAEKISQVMEENSNLKRENEMLLETVNQMRTTLDRLISRYISDIPEMNN